MEAKETVVEKYNRELDEIQQLKKGIDYNLEMAKPLFLYFIKNMNKELSQWIQYNGIEIESDKMFFKFKSSQNSLNFKIYCGLNVNDIYYLLRGKSNEIFEFFKKLKYENF